MTEHNEVILRQFGIYANGMTIGIRAPRGELETVRRSVRGRRGDTHDACCTSRDLEVRGDKVEGGFETGEQGGGKEGNIAATFDGQGAEDGESDEEGARGGEGERMERGGLGRSRSCTWISCESFGALCS